MGAADFYVMLWRRGASGAGDAGRTFAILLAVPEVTSLAELAGKNIAIDEAAPRRTTKRGVSSRLCQREIGRRPGEGAGSADQRGSARGSPDAGLSRDGRVVPEIAGFKVFRIPLMDGPEMAGLAPGNPRPR